MTIKRMLTATTAALVLTAGLSGSALAAADPRASCMGVISSNAAPGARSELKSLGGQVIREIAQTRGAEGCPTGGGGEG